MFNSNKFGRIFWIDNNNDFRSCPQFNNGTGDLKWLNIAKPIAEMLLEYGRNDKGEWFYSIKGDGSPAQQPQSIYVDAFCTYGLTEFAKATGDKKALKAAQETFERVSPILDDPSSLR